jgi:hypothetical protein
MVTVGELSRRFGFQVTAAFIGSLVPIRRTDHKAQLWNEGDVPAIKAAIINKLKEDGL